MVGFLTQRDYLPSDPLERAKALDLFILDSHNDLPWELRSHTTSDNLSPLLDISQNLTGTTHTDLSRLRAGKVGAQIWSVCVPRSAQPYPLPRGCFAMRLSQCLRYVPCAAGGGAPQMTFEQIDLAKRMIAAHSDTLQLVRPLSAFVSVSSAAADGEGAQALTVADVYQARSRGKIASLLGMEGRNTALAAPVPHNAALGGHSINSSLALLRTFYQVGARYMTLTHSCSLPWAESCYPGPDQPPGLSSLGRDIVREMNRLGIRLASVIACR